MADPLSWQLLEAVQEALEQILKANGYRTDAGAAVTLEPGQVLDDATEFLAVVLDSMNASLNPALRVSGRAVVVAIIAKVPTELDDAQLRLHEILEDVELAMKDQQKLFPEGLDYPKFISMERLPPAEGLKWTGAVIRYAANTRR